MENPVHPANNSSPESLTTTTNLNVDNKYFPKNKKLKTFLIIGCLLLLCLVSLFLFAKNNNRRIVRVPEVYPTSPPPFSVISPTPYSTNTPTRKPNSIEPTPTAVPIITLPPAPSVNGWKTYVDPKTGVSLKYPPSFIFNNYSLETVDNFHLNVFSESYSELKKADDEGIAPNNVGVGYSPESFINDLDGLSRGAYGWNTDFACHNSQRVVNLGKIFAKSFVVLGRFETHNVTFERMAIFYPNKDYRIIINLSGPLNKIMDENRTYFSSIPDEPWWINSDNPDKGWGQNLFCQDLVRGKTGPISQQWYKTFDDILATIAFK